MRGPRRKSKTKLLRRVEVSLDGATITMAVKLGDGDLSLGIRRAVILAIKKLPSAKESPGR